LRLKYKAEGNDVGDRLVKLLLNSLYGKTVQKDILTTSHLWSHKTLENSYTELVINYEKIKDDLYFVEKLNEETEFSASNSFQIDVTKGDAKAKKNVTRLMPSHLGSFILSHSRRIMNNFILAINGFKDPVIYYTDTDSIYIHKKYWICWK